MGVLADWQIKRDLKIEPWADAQKRPGVISFGCTSYGYDVRVGYEFLVLKPYPAGILDPKAFDEKAMFEKVDLTPERCLVELDAMHKRYYCMRCAQEINPDRGPRPLCPKSTKPNYIDMPPYSFMLGESVERFTIPRDVLVVNVGKSTYARCGLIVNVTPGEPEWNGVWTLELTNPTPRTLRVYAGEGIMQSMFFRGDGRYELALAAVHTYFQNYTGVPDPKEHEDAREAYELLRRLSLREPPPIEMDVGGKMITGNLEGTCTISYADKKGKYQDQAGLTAPTVDGGSVRDRVLKNIENTPFHLDKRKGTLPAPECCPATMIYDGHNFRCSIDSGHAGPHESGGWKWTSSAVVGSPPEEEKCMKERNAEVEVHCPKCKCWITIPADRVDSYTDRQCPVCGSDMPFLPARNTGPTNPIAAVEAKLKADGFVRADLAPPAAADKKVPWKSPDGSTWHYSYSNEKWVRVPAAEEKK